MRSRTDGIIVALIVAALVMLLGSASPHLSAQVAAPGTAVRCRVTGRAVSAGVPLPGVSIVIRGDGAVKAATSTDLDGTYTILFAPDAAYDVSADLPGFSPITREVTFGAAPCDRTLDLQLTLKSRDEAAAPSAPEGAPRPGNGRGRGGANQTAGGRGGAPGFETLNVQPDAGLSAILDVAPIENADAGALLPAGFSLQDAQSDAIAIAGGRNTANLDRGLMNDRFQAINSGQFDPSTGQFAPGFGPAGDQGFGGFGGGGFGPGGGGPGGRGFGPGGPGGGRGFGPGGRGGFVLGGRGARAQNPYQGSATYTFGGSALDSPPYQLRPDVPVTQPTFVQNTVGGTIGGPLKIPGLYKDTNRRTNFQINYTGNHSSNLFDQYATVPTDAMRAGDFSGSSLTLIDPTTGQPFPGNQIPASRIDPTSAALMSVIPPPNLPGNIQNFHTSTTAATSSDAVSLRVIQNLSPESQIGAGGPGGRGGFGGRGFGGRGGGGGRGGPAARGTNVVLNAQLQYRRNDTQAINVFPGLGGETTNTSIAAPIGLNVVHGRTIQNFNVNVAHTEATTTNGFAGRENVAGDAGIQYPSTASTDPMNWGVPNLVFSGMTAVRGAAASSRDDTRVTAGYAWIHPMPKHQLRAGGDVRLDRSTSDINANARGTFTFTGLYSDGGVSAPRGTGADFADFLLGMPQQASVQVGQTSELRQHSFDAYIEDNWQRSSKLTFNLGLRYELALPFVEVNGRMANLDAAPGLTTVASVTPGEAGPFTGVFPAGLLNKDLHDLGPRLGLAYRLRPRTILRGGYSITYNSGSYASIARQLVGQPPFADTETITATSDTPLTLAEALLTPAPATSNNWGVDRDYELGMIQTWNASLQHNLTQDWMLQATYTGIKGTDLDVLRAPALGPGGLLIPGIEPFIWESSGGHSIMNAGNVQLRRRLAHGIAGGFSYTVAKAMDNASSLGAGGAVVAQNDRDLAAEWAPSTFDRRQQFSGNLYYELPWGPNRRWLNNGGTLAQFLGEWSAQLTLTMQTGTPLTARVLGAASDLLRGVNGSLRANYNGAPIALSDPTVDEFFNITAFSQPLPGQFGSSTRDMIVGPGSHQLNALFQRDVRIGGNRAMTLQVNANNLLNTVQWAAVDTNINSPTFGQVTSARPMRTMTVTARFRF
jgi:hypothetical protein